MKYLSWPLAALTAVLPYQINAEETTDAKTAPTEPVEQVIVTGSAFKKNPLEMTTPATVLVDEELMRKKGVTLGETLQQELGVTTSYFGPGVGRPIIRGLDGPRVQVLQNGLGAMDASAVSVDHAVTIEPLLAKQIEILRGPASLLYGSSAMGGVVNVVDNRIPTEAPKNGVSGGVELRVDSVARDKAGVATLDVGGDRWAWHIDGSKRETEEYKIPGQANRIPNPRDPSGKLENSDVDNHSVGAGASWVSERGYVGASVAQLDSNYGIPGHEEEEKESGEIEKLFIRIDMKQTRYELASALDEPFAGFARAQFRLSHNDYEHQELENGESGTQFKNKAYEGRLELQHKALAGWQGVIGAQHGNRDFSLTGDEAFLPSYQQKASGWFVVEEYTLAPWRFELGARYEQQDTRPQGDLARRNDHGASTSIGAVWHMTPSYHLALSAGYTQRLPSAEELFANGPHLAVGAFQIGDPQLLKERAHHVDISLRKPGGRVQVEWNVFIHDIRDFIHLRETGEEKEGLPVQQYVQADARLWGSEIQMTVPWRTQSDYEIKTQVFADTVRGTLRNGENIPRIPPLRFGARLQYGYRDWDAQLEVVRVNEQNKLAPLETASKSYSLINADVSYKILKGPTEYLLFLQGRNLLNEEARVHSSFLKDRAPLPGRNFMVGVRASF